MTRLRTALALPLLLLTGLAACNTAQGFGEDVQAGGQAVEDTAEEAQDELSD